MVLFDSFVVDLNRMTRADMFVKNHIDAMDSQLTLAVSKAVKPNKNKENVKCDKNDRSAPITVRKTNDTDTMFNKTETMIANKDRNKNSILNPQMRSHVNHDVPTLPNGSELQRSNKSIVLTHACGFNSVTSVYSAMYIDHSTMRSQIDSSTSKYAEFIKLLFQHKQINSKIEFARYEFLKEVFPDRTAIKERNNLISFKCDIAVAGLYTSMCSSNADIMSSRQRTEKCSTRTCF